MKTVKDLTIVLPEEVYDRLERVARENGVTPQDLLRVQVERFVRSYHGPNVDSEVRRHLQETIEEYRSVLERLAI